MCMVFSGISWRTTFFDPLLGTLCGQVDFCIPVFQHSAVECPWKANYAARVLDDTKHGTRIGFEYNYSSCLALSHPLVATQWVTMMMLDPAWAETWYVGLQEGINI